MERKATEEGLEERARESGKKPFDPNQAGEAPVTPDPEREKGVESRATRVAGTGGQWIGPKTLLDNILRYSGGDVVMATDMEMRILLYNQRAKEVFGYDEGDVLGKSVYEMHMKGNVDPARLERAVRTIREKGVYEYDFHIADSEGSDRCFHSVVTPLNDENGEQLGFVLNSRDVTVSRRAEEALRESEAKLRTIIENSNELFYIHDTKHILMYVSPTSENILGYTPEEMMRKWTELATDNPINQKGLEITEKGIATGEKQAPYLLELEKKDGTVVLLEIDESPVKDETGKVVAISGAARDVTEQKRIEQRLLKSEKGFRDLFDSITDLIYTQDLNGRFTTVNRAMTTLFGHDKDTFIGKPASDFMKPEMRHLFKSEYLEQIKTKGYYAGITSYYKKNGDEIYIEYRSSLVKPDHGAPYISGTGRDVTERILSQREIKRLQQQVHQIGSEGAEAPVCPQNRAYGSVHGSSCYLYPLIKVEPPVVMFVGPYL